MLSSVPVQAGQLKFPSGNHNRNDSLLTDNRHFIGHKQEIETWVVTVKTWLHDIHSINAIVWSYQIQTKQISDLPFLTTCWQTRSFREFLRSFLGFLFPIGKVLCGLTQIIPEIIPETSDTVSKYTYYVTMANMGSFLLGRVVLRSVETRECNYIYIQLSMKGRLRTHPN